MASPIPTAIRPPTVSAAFLYGSASLGEPIPQPESDLRSIHANASRDRLVGGIATYHLRARRASAARGDAALKDLDESRDLAELVQRNLIRGIRDLHPEARDLGVKQGRFAVLIGANMPSVLTEVSFLTNQEEAALLATDAYRDRISDALFQSILEYQLTPTSFPR